MYGSRANYGKIDVSRLSYDVVEALGIANPFNQAAKVAGKGWLLGFMRRHPELSIRRSQGTNIARAVGFNKSKVARFFAIYKELLPMFLFPRRRTVEVLMNGAPPQWGATTMGRHHNISGKQRLVDAEMFVTWFNHFVKFT